MRYGWDEEKSAWNQQSRGLNFAEGKPVFLDPYSMDRYDAKHSTILEERYIRIGKALAGLLTVVYTDLPGELRWIISVRRATRTEKETYYDQ